MTLTGGNRHDVTQLLPLLDAVPPIRGVRGCPRRKPRCLYADRGYDFDKYRRLLWKRGIKPVIARRGVAHGSGLGKIRWVVKRTFAGLHQFKRLRTRLRTPRRPPGATRPGLQPHMPPPPSDLILKRSVGRSPRQPVPHHSAGLLYFASVALLVDASWKTSSHGPVLTSISLPKPTHFPTIRRPVGSASI